jgi:hypothetical protein
MATRLRRRHQLKRSGGKLSAAVTLGRRGGLRGGPARARSLTPGERTKIARMGARAKNSAATPRRKYRRGTYGAGGKKG